jgi:hypothetical protein
MLLDRIRVAAPAAHDLDNYLIEWGLLRGDHVEELGGSCDHHAPRGPAASKPLSASLLRNQPVTRPEAGSIRSRTLPPWLSWEDWPITQTASRR